MYMIFSYYLQQLPRHNDKTMGNVQAARHDTWCIRLRRIKVAALSSVLIMLSFASFRRYQEVVRIAERGYGAKQRWLLPVISLVVFSFHPGILMKRLMVPVTGRDSLFTWLRRKMAVALSSRFAHYFLPPLRHCWRTLLSGSDSWSVL